MSSTHLKTALITGASRGIGYHLTQLFARDKHGLILVSRTKSDLERLKEELKLKYNCLQITIIPKDLSKSNSANELFREIKDKYQLDVDILVNNAGSGVRGEVWKTKIQDDIDAIHVNVLSVVQLTKLILPEMIERNRGRILMLGNSASFQPGPLLANYSATKAFIANYTDALINELKDYNVTATLLVPGPTDTEFFKRAGASQTMVNTLNVLDDPKDVALAGYEALLKGQHRAYGSTKVKLLVGVGHVIPNEILTKAGHLLMKEKDS